MTPRLRAVASKNSDVAKQRNILFAAGFNRIKSAIEAGYYIEAICLLESWIGDRLESHLGFVTKSEHGFKTLDALVRVYKSSPEVDPELKRLVVEEVSVWKNYRNKAAHELMKIEKNTFIKWEERLSSNKKPAEDGLSILRKIDRRIMQFRRQNYNASNDVSLAVG